MERYVGKHQKEPGHQTRDTASPVDYVRSPGPSTLRGTTEAFAPRLFGSHVTKTNLLESLVVAPDMTGRIAVRHSLRSMSRRTTSGIGRSVRGWWYQARGARACAPCRVSN
jgi:hypothetical protein